MTQRYALENADVTIAAALTLAIGTGGTPYAERLLFPVMNGGTEDPDEGMGMMPMMKQAAGKVKDVITGNEHEPTSRRN